MRKDVDTSGVNEIGSPKRIFARDRRRTEMSEGSTYVSVWREMWEEVIPDRNYRERAPKTETKCVFGESRPSSETNLPRTQRPRNETDIL